MKNLLLFSLLLWPFFASAQQPAEPLFNANFAKYAVSDSILKANPVADRVVFMGNSITEGWLMNDSSFFANNLYVDRGISGQTTLQMLLRFRRDVIELQPKVVVILAGINDIAENTGPISIENIFGNIKSMAQLAWANKIRVVLCSVLPAYDFPWKPNMAPAEKVVKLNQLIKTFADENNIIYADYYSAMVDSRKGLDPKYTLDEVHPTLAGYKIMEPIVVDAITKALSQKKKRLKKF